MNSDSFRRILVAVDGSEQAKAAGRAAAALATTPGAHVRVMHVWSLEAHVRNGVWDLETRSEAEALIRGNVNWLRGHGVEADGELMCAAMNHVASAVADSARSFNADLIVIGSRRLSDWQAMIHHSVSHDVLVEVRCPVLVVRSGHDRTVHRPRRVLVAIAGGPDVVPAVQAAAAVAAAPGSEVLVVHVAQAILVGMQGYEFFESGQESQATIDQAVALLLDHGINPATRICNPGPVARQISQIAREWGADVIVTGPSRVGSLTSLFLGSVTHGLLRGTDIPILVSAGG